MLINFKRSQVECYISLLLLIIFSFLFLRKISLIQILAINNSWMTGDWLINYSGGFVRRGASGELVKIISTAANISVAGAVLALKLFFYNLMVLALIGLCVIKKIRLIELILLMAPWGLMFYLNDANGSGRKEIALIAFFLVYILIDLSLGWRRASWEFWYLTFAFLFLMLIHEGMFFFLHFFVMYRYLRNSTLDRSVLLGLLLYAISFLLLIAFALFYKGDADTAAIVCINVINLGFDSDICNGAISALGGFDFEVHEGYWKTYVSAFVASLLPVLIYGFSVFQAKSRGWVIVVGLICMLPAMPLYLLAADWGRWIHISIFMLFAAFFSLRGADQEAKSNLLDLRLFWLGLVFGCFYIVSWSIPHFIGAGAGAGVYFYKQSFSEWLMRFN